MYNYNVINPVNIHYRKYSKDENTNLSDEKIKSSTEEKQGQRRFPNGNKVAIDYTKNSINISQILQDFRSTVAAINSPEDVKEEVELYLKLITKETQKSSPSKDIVLANLKNAAITPSRVVEDWVDALFLQQINLKPDPNDINEEFKVKIPEKKQSPYIEQANNVNNFHNPSGIKPLQEDKVEFENKTVSTNVEQTYIENNNIFNVSDDNNYTDRLLKDILKNTEEFDWLFHKVIDFQTRVLIWKLKVTLRKEAKRADFNRICNCLAALSARLSERKDRLNG